MSATAFRSASTTEKCVVSVLSAGHSKLVGEETEARSSRIVRRSCAAYSFETSRCDRHVLHRLGVAEVASAVGEGAPQRLGDEVDVARRSRSRMARRS